jgi:hypothetical protein
MEIFSEFLLFFPVAASFCLGSMLGLMWELPVILMVVADFHLVSV